MVLNPCSEEVANRWLQVQNMWGKTLSTAINEQIISYDIIRMYIYIYRLTLHRCGPVAVAAAAATIVGGGFDLFPAGLINCKGKRILTEGRHKGDKLGRHI
jgi:hypothetical protein